jgi:hypothetical protein
MALHPDMEVLKKEKGKAKTGFVLFHPFYAAGKDCQLKLEFFFPFS